MSFRVWLKNYQGGDRDIANLATDAEINPPDGNWSHKDLRQHMLNCGAGACSMEALEIAIDAWNRDRQRVAETQKTL